MKYFLYLSKKKLTFTNIDKKNISTPLVAVHEYFPLIIKWLRFFFFSGYWKKSSYQTLSQHPTSELKIFSTHNFFYICHYLHYYQNVIALENLFMELQFFKLIWYQITSPKLTKNGNRDFENFRDFYKLWKET